MEIPFDALLTVLIFLVGIPALILQLISPTERHAALKKGRLDVRSFLKKALLFIAGGILLQLLLFFLRVGDDDTQQLLRQLAWVILFSLLFALALDIAQKIPEQYGRREKIVEALTRDVLSELPKRQRLNVSGETFRDLANLGKHCDAGQEREMVVSALVEIASAVLADSRYVGDSFETLIEELVHMLAFNPETKDLYNYRTAVDILSAILAAGHSGETDDDRRRAAHAISHLARTLIINFNSVERDNVILAYVDSLEFALFKPNMFTEVSQALFEIGISAAEADHDFVAVAALDKLTSLAGRHPIPLPVEFVADMFGLLAHYWGMDGSRKEYAIRKFEETKKFLGKNKIQTLKKAQSHLVATMYFDEADKLGQMIGKI
jgi:hypothetical protein